MSWQSDSISGKNGPVINHKFFHNSKWKQLNTDTNTQSLLHNFDIIPDTARALFDMVQRRTEAAAPNAVNAALTVVSVTPTLGSGSSSTAATTRGTGAKAKAKKTPVVISTDLDDYTLSELTAAMENANGGDIFIRMHVDWARSPQSILGRE